MNKLLAAAALGAMVLSSTAAQAATRPEQTRLAQPVEPASALADEDDEGDEGFAWEVAVLALGGILAILAFAGSSHGNSPR